MIVKLIAPLIWSGLAAQTPLTLDEALRVAEQNAFGIRLAQSDVEKTRQQVAEARGLLGPQVRVDTNYTRNEREVRQGGVTVVPLDQAQSQVVLTMPLDITGVLKRGLSASSLAINVARENLAAERNDLRFNVRAAYHDVLRARAQVKVFEETLQSAKAAERNAELEYQAGAKAKVDVLRFQTQTQQAESDLIAAQNALAIARNLFNNTLGRPIETPVELVEPGAIPTPDQDEKALAETAKANRPELRAFRFNQEVLKQIRMAEERGMLPSLNVSAIHSRNWTGGGQGGDDASTFAQLNLSIPVWDSGVTRARVRQARQDEEQNKIRWEQTELLVSLEVRQALTNLINARARLETAQKQVDFAAETFRLANLRYQAGEGIPLEVTDAQTELTRARTLFVSANYDYLTAHAQLLRALGVDVPAGQAKAKEVSK
jgi:outer membrane protein TolC